MMLGLDCSHRFHLRTLVLREERVCAANQERLATKGCYGGIMKLCRSVLLDLLR